MKIPFLLVVFFLLMSGENILPFLFVAFALLVVLRGVKQTAYRFEPRPAVTTEALAGLRNDVAVGLLDVDDDMRLRASPEARARFEAAGSYYTKASKVLDRGVRRRDRDAVASTLYRARYELEATAAALEGRTLPPEPPRPPARGQTMVVQRPTRQHRRSCCGW